MHLFSFSEPVIHKEPAIEGDQNVQFYWMVKILFNCVFHRMWYSLVALFYCVILIKLGFVHQKEKMEVQSFQLNL